MVLYSRDIVLRYPYIMTKIGFSNMHGEKMNEYFDMMATSKLLSFDNIFTIIAYSGNLSVTEQFLLKVSSSTRQLKKTKQLFYSMLIFDILEAAANQCPHIILPEHACTHINDTTLSHWLSLHDYF